jgi:diguanylate cyclase (GGDEF)-like protein
MHAGAIQDDTAAMLLALHEHSPQLLALFDAQDVLRYANPAFCAAFAAQPDGRCTWTEMMRTSHAQGRGSVVHAADFEAWLASALSRRGKQLFRAFEADLCDGRWIWMTETVHANGWMLCLASDITGLRQDGRALRQAHDLALRAAQTDALTGLSNRRHVLQQLDLALQQGQRGKRAPDGALCVAALDLDHFKRINDSLGHAAGDLVICDFARHLQASTRREDGCGRIGGEEFMLLLPGVTLETACAIVQRLLEQVRRARPLPNQPERGYTASAGLAMAQPQDSAADLIRRADEALYAAKAAGRDRLECAP